MKPMSFSANAAVIGGNIGAFSIGNDVCRDERSILNITVFVKSKDFDEYVNGVLYARFRRPPGDVRTNIVDPSDCSGHYALLVSNIGRERRLFPPPNRGANRAARLFAQLRLSAGLDEAAIAEKSLGTD
jgi:hypothetical protein